MITIVHTHPKQVHVFNERGKRVLGEAYFKGKLKPSYPVPARYHVDLDPDGLDTLDILGNIIFHADSIFYQH